MLDRQEYELQLKKIREAQINEISSYLEDYLKLNARIRELPFSPDDSERLLKEVEEIPISRKGRPVKEVADELVTKVFSKSMLVQHPKFLSFVTSAVSPYSLAGAVLSDIYNLNLGGFENAPTASIIEEKLIRWMGSLAGYDDKCGGVFTSGGSLANLTGCIAARINLLEEDDYPLAVAYCSDQTHSSVKKGLKLMGIKKANIRIIPSDKEYKIDLAELEKEIKEDLNNGNKPFLIIGNLGSTNTGSIDPLDKLGEIKERYNMWLHVDGAFGGSILFSEIYRNYAKGVEMADSLSWDTHKWAMQIYSSSCLIAKDKTKLVNAFAEHPEYLADVISQEHTDGWDLGIEMSRPARFIKLWFTIQAMGTDLLSDIIDYSFYNAKIALKELQKNPDFEITSPMQCATLTFRYAPNDIKPERYDELQTMISREIINNNYAYIVTTTIDGKRVLRLNMINGNTTSDDIVEVISKINEVARNLHNHYKEQ